jgi:hypothetical protein
MYYALPALLQLASEAVASQFTIGPAGECAPDPSDHHRHRWPWERPGFGGGTSVESQATRLSYRASLSVGNLPPGHGRFNIDMGGELSAAPG